MAKIVKGNRRTVVPFNIRGGLLFVFYWSCSRLGAMSVLYGVVFEAYKQPLISYLQMFESQRLIQKLCMGSMNVVGKHAIESFIQE